MAELAYGEARDQPGTVILLTVGTGIGSALISEGRLVPNTEFGHILMRNKGAETLVSGAARLRRKLGWKRWARDFNEYLAMLEFFLWPDRIILGGGVSKESQRYWQYLQHQRGAGEGALPQHLGHHRRGLRRRPGRPRGTSAVGDAGGRRPSGWRQASPSPQAQLTRQHGRAMQVHLLDGTYELFRAHFGRPPHAGADGQPVGATLGVVESVALALPRRRRHAPRLRHGPRHPLLAQRSLRGLQDGGRHAPRAAGPVRPAGGRPAGARGRRLAHGRVRGRRWAGRRGGTLRRPPVGRARHHPLAGQGHGPVRARRTGGC